LLYHIKLRRLRSRAQGFVLWRQQFNLNANLK
jgi:hypothetical protein